MPFFDMVRRFLSLPTREEREARKLNVQLDANLFRNLCHSLHAEAPQGSSILVMEAHMPENDADSGCELECHVKKATGKNARFTPSDKAQQQICGWLHELRGSMESQKQPRWKGMKLTVDVGGDKYNADFRY